MAITAGSVERWRDLSMGELRDRVWQLVVAKLGRDHVVWTAIRRDPVLAARVRGALTGLSSAAAGTRDEAMRRMWIAAAKQALDGPSPTMDKVMDAAVTPQPEAVAPTLSSPSPLPPAARAAAQEPVLDPEPARATPPRPTIPQVVFRAP
ncbi:MAG TPA: hypothetical protein VGD67_12005 [Pseudonocardiaceae bacterium]